MRFISTKTHAVLDYLGGIALIILPMIMWWDDGGPAVWVPVAIGIIMIVQALFTDYELSLANLIPVPIHLVMDALAGVVLAASPWLFDFEEIVWLPHVILGVAEIGAALTTRLHRGESAHGLHGSQRSVQT